MPFVRKSPKQRVTVVKSGVLRGHRAQLGRRRFQFAAERRSGLCFLQQSPSLWHLTKRSLSTMKRGSKLPSFKGGKFEFHHASGYHGTLIVQVQKQHSLKTKTPRHHDLPQSIACDRLLRRGHPRFRIGLFRPHAVQP